MLCYKFFNFQAIFFFFGFLSKVNFFFLLSRSRCWGCVSLTNHLAGIWQIRVWDLQPRVPEGPESSNAQEEAQGAMEAAKEGNSTRGASEEEGVCVPWANLFAPWPLPCPWGPCGNQEALQKEAQQSQAVGLWQVFQRVCCSIWLQGSHQNLWHQGPFLWLWPCLFQVNYFLCILFSFPS